MLLVSDGTFEGRRSHTISVDGFPERRADGEDGRNEDVLEARDEEQGRVLIVERLELLVVDIGLGVPKHQQLRRFS